MFWGFCVESNHVGLKHTSSVSSSHQPLKYAMIIILKLHYMQLVRQMAEIACTYDKVSGIDLSNHPHLADA